MDQAWEDWSVIDAASWRLATELVRRHPTTTMLVRTFPGDGMYDCLTIRSSIGAPGHIDLNRNGRMHIHHRFDGRPVHWEPAEWDTYLRADPRGFMHLLESAAGLPAPSTVPASTASTIILRVLATLQATNFKTVKRIDIQHGCDDTDDGYAVPLRAFLFIPPEAVAGRAELYGHPGAKFWIVTHGDKPMLAFNMLDGTAHAPHAGKAVVVLDLYQQYRRDLLYTTANLWRWAQNLQPL